MNALYWFALIVGVGMFLVSIGADFLGDADIHADTDVHFGGDVGHDVDHGAEGFRILSVRNATYFLFAFGVSGVLLSWLWGGSRGFLTAMVSTLLGVAGGSISSFAFGWVRKTESGVMMDDTGWVGLDGKVTLTLTAGGTGKIDVVRGGRQHELLARPFDAEADRPEQWTDVMVIDMQQGVALVAPRDPELSGGERPRIPPTTES
jgi:hypothetical protein